MSGNRNIRDFFRSTQAAPITTAQSQPSTLKKPRIPPAPLKSPGPTTRQGQPPLPKAYASSNLSPESPPASPAEDSRPSGRPTWNNSSVTEIQDSGSEDEDSDSSIEDLATLLAMTTSKAKSKQTSSQKNGPNTPVRAKRTRSKYDFHSSPLAVLPKYKFDLKSLVSHAEKDEATEASSKRVKAMLAIKEEEKSFHMASEVSLTSDSLVQGNSLEFVVTGTEDDDAHRVKRALMRTEAGIIERRWYFFNRDPNPVKTQSRTFPATSVPREWRQELRDPKTRYQSFVSGFVEDMVTMGMRLPDDIFLWILDEICFEASEPLRVAYTNVLGASREQVQRLITPVAVQRVFCQVGGTLNATSPTEKIKPAPKVENPYSRKDWSTLISIIKLFGCTSKRLTQLSRTHVMCMLLRLSVDHLVFETIDLLVSIQDTIHHICRHTPDKEWESFCKDVCRMLFACIELPTMRLSIVQCMPSITPQTHDLRRRLAMCFFFNHLSYSMEHSHNLTDLALFMNRLDSPDFVANSKTDFKELAALISLLDVAVDDARSTKLDLSNAANEARFNKSVDDLGERMKDIMKTVGNPGAAFISKLEAKQALDIASQRVTTTLRSKPRLREGWFDRPRGRREEDLENEKRGMASFVTKMERITNDASAVNDNNNSYNMR